jgi:hypothetical protein
MTAQHRPHHTRRGLRQHLLPMVLYLCAASHAAAQGSLQPEGWDAGVQLPEAADTNPDPRVGEITLEARIARVEIAPGEAIEAWTHDGGVPGPLIRVRVGDRLIVHFTNRLPAPTTVHWRLTPHGRHREKYVDVPVTEHSAFVFSADGHAPFRRVRTLREFVAAVESHNAATLDGSLRRGDFSRWIGDVFGDRALVDDLRRDEERYRVGVDREALPEIAVAIRGRSDPTDVTD